ncbi:MAG: RNA methyltransferase [Balneolaceae bacterium]
MNLPEASNRQLTLWRKLLLRKHRRREGCFLAEGERCVEQILENGVIRVREILFMDGFTPSGIISESGLPMYQVSREEFAGIADTENPQGVSALCEIPAEPSLNVLGEKSRLLIATDGIQDPGNLGTMIRTAVWFGAGGLLSGTGTVDVWHPKVVRSSAGSTGLLPVLNLDLEEALARMSDAGWKIWLLDGGEKSTPLHKSGPEEKCVIIVGNEANGIRPELMEARPGWCRKRIEGAGTGGVESLNAAIALGIALHHSRSTISM